MQRVAAEAQVRVEKFKQGDYDEDKAELDNQNGHSFSSLFVNTDKRSTSTTVDKNLPHTIKFLSKHPIRTSAAVDPESSAECQLDAPVISVKPSNVTVLEAMKQQMARDIQEQIASTKYVMTQLGFTDFSLLRIYVVLFPHRGIKEPLYEKWKSAVRAGKRCKRKRKSYDSCSNNSQRGRQRWIQQ